MRLTRFFILPILAAFSALAADQALLQLIVPEARIVAGMDVDRAKESYFGQKILAEFNSKENDFGKLVAATGFDPRRDLREVLVAATDTTGKNTPGLVLAKGTFEPSRITTFLKTSGATLVESVGGVDVYTGPSKNGGHNDAVIAIIDSSLAIGGSPALVRAALLRRGGNATSMTAESMARVQSVSRANDLWMVSTIPVADLSKALPGGNTGDAKGMMNGDAFKAIEQMAMGVHFAADMIDLTAEAVARTEKDAIALADIARFLASMVHLNRDKPEMKGLATALDGMKLTTEARTTRLSVSLPTSEIEKVIQPKNKNVQKKI